MKCRIVRYSEKDYAVESLAGTYWTVQARFGSLEGAVSSLVQHGPVVVAETTDHITNDEVATLKGEVFYIRRVLQQLGDILRTLA